MSSFEVQTTGTSSKHEFEKMRRERCQFFAMQLAGAGHSLDIPVEWADEMGNAQVVRIFSWRNLYLESSARDLSIGEIISNLSFLELVMFK